MPILRITVFEPISGTKTGKEKQVGYKAVHIPSHLTEAQKKRKVQEELREFEKEFPDMSSSKYFFTEK